MAAGGRYARTYIDEVGLTPQDKLEIRFDVNNRFGKPISLEWSFVPGIISIMDFEFRQQGMAVAIKGMHDAKLIHFKQLRVVAKLQRHQLSTLLIHNVSNLESPK